MQIARNQNKFNESFVCRSIVSKRSHQILKTRAQHDGQFETAFENILYSIRLSRRKLLYKLYKYIHTRIEQNELLTSRQAMNPDIYCENLGLTLKCVVSCEFRVSVLFRGINELSQITSLD